AARGRHFRAGRLAAAVRGGRFRGDDQAAAVPGAGWAVRDAGDVRGGQTEGVRQTPHAGNSIVILSSRRIFQVPDSGGGEILRLRSQARSAQDDNGGRAGSAQDDNER